MARLLDEDRLFPVEPSVRSLARALYAEVRDLPIVSPHGHTDPRWFAVLRIHHRSHDGRLCTAVDRQ